MKIKDAVKRLRPRRSYVVLDNEEVSKLLSQLDFYKREGFTFSSFSFLNNNLMEVNK